MWILSNFRLFVCFSNFDVRSLNGIDSIDIEKWMTMKQIVCLSRHWEEVCDKFKSNTETAVKTSSMEYWTKNKWGRSIKIVRGVDELEGGHLLMMSNVKIDFGGSKVQIFNKSPFKTWKTGVCGNLRSRLSILEYLGLCCMIIKNSYCFTPFILLKSHSHFHQKLLQTLKTRLNLKICPKWKIYLTYCVT